MRIFEVLWRRRIAMLIVMAFGVLGALAVWLLLPPKYQATAAVLLESEQVGSRDPAFSADDMPTLLESSTVIEKTLREFHIERTPDDFESDITAKVGFDSSVMPIQYVDKSPSRAIAVANGLAQNLSDYYRQITRSKYDNLNAYLTTAIAKRQGQLERLDRQLQRAAAADPALAQDDALTTLTQRLNALVARRDEVNATETGQQAEAASTATQLGQIMPLVHQEIAESDYLYRSLQEQHAKDGALLSSELSQYKLDYPGLRGLAKRVNKENAFAERRARELANKPPAGSQAYVSALAEKNKSQAAASGVAAQLGALDGEIAEVKQQIALVPSKGVHVEALRRQRDAAAQAFGALEQRRELVLAEQAQAASLGTITIVDRAEKAYPNVGKHGALLAIGAVFGFVILAVTIAFLLESTDRRLRTVDAIAQLYGKPVIATMSAR
jgi:uncharacterized protein involved in exopolysaccharide biosynthesis